MDEPLLLGRFHSRWRLRLLPQRGSAWLSAEARDASGHWHHVLQPTPPDVLAVDRRLHYANYPLLPYSNRVGQGVICAARRQAVPQPLPGNWPGIAHPIHGLGWLQSWRVQARSARAALLHFHWDGGPAWPWRFEAEQRLQLLGKDVLQLDLMLRNRDAREMPAGLGWHPCFARRSRLQLCLRADQRQLMGADELPCGVEPAHPNLVSGRAAPADDLVGTDSAFTGWRGRARLRWPELAVDLHAAGALAEHLVIYAPPSNDVICLEPVSHLNNALGQVPPLAAGWGQRWLAPGAELRGRVRLALRG